MKPEILIISKMDGDIYVYTESLQHHANVQSNTYAERPASKRVPFSVFENECLASEALKEGEWTSVIVFSDD